MMAGLIVVVFAAVAYGALKLADEWRKTRQTLSESRVSKTLYPNTSNVYRQVNGHKSTRLN